MSSNSSIDLSELSDAANDSQGHALARFLMKKNCVQKPVRLYGKLKDRRISVRVELNKTSEKEVDGQDNEERQNESSLQKEQNAKTPERPERVQTSVSPLRINNNAAPRISSNYLEVNQSSDVENHAMCIDDLNVPRTPQTQRPGNDLQTPRSSQPRNRMCSSDRLRRLSFKHLQSGTSRRVLLNELNTVDESSMFSQFEPVKTSTPACMSPTTAAAHANINRPNLIEKQPAIVPTSSTIHSAMTALSKSFVIEKGPKPGQLILTPSKTANENPTASNEKNSSIQQISEPVPAHATGYKKSSANDKTIQENIEETNNSLPLRSKRITDYSAISMILTEDEDETDDNEDNEDHCNTNNVNTTVVSVVKQPQSQQVSSSNVINEENRTFVRPRTPIQRKSKRTIIGAVDIESEVDDANDGDIEDTLHQPAVTNLISLRKTLCHVNQSSSFISEIKKIRGRRPLRKETPDAVKDYKNATKDIRVNANRCYADKSKRSLFSETACTTPEMEVASNDNTTKSVTVPSMPSVYKNLNSVEVCEKSSDPPVLTSGKSITSKTRLRKAKQTKMTQELSSTKSRKTNPNLKDLRAEKMGTRSQKSKSVTLDPAQSSGNNTEPNNQSHEKLLSRKNDQQPSSSDSETCDSENENSQNNKSPKKSYVHESRHSQVQGKISDPVSHQINQYVSDHRSEDSSSENEIQTESVNQNMNTEKVFEKSPESAREQPKALRTHLSKRKQTKVNEKLLASKSRNENQKLENLETEKNRMRSQKSKSVTVEPTQFCEHNTEPNNQSKVPRKMAHENLSPDQQPSSSDSESCESEHKKSLNKTSSNQKLSAHKTRHTESTPESSQSNQSSSDNQSQDSCSENEIQPNNECHERTLVDGSGDDSCEENEALSNTKIPSGNRKSVAHNIAEHAELHRKSQKQQDISSTNKSHNAQVHVKKSGISKKRKQRKRVYKTENKPVSDCGSHENEELILRSQTFPKEIPEPRITATSKSRKNKEKHSKKDVITNEEPTRKSTRTRRPVEMHPYAAELWSLAWGDRAHQLTEKRRKKNEMKSESQLHEDRENAFDKLRNERKRKVPQNKKEDKEKNFEPFIKLRRIDKTLTAEQQHDIELPSSSSATTTSTKANESPCSKVISRLLTLPATAENFNSTEVLNANDNPYINHAHLQFYDNKGIEVAFYSDNPDEVSIGYMRFKPFVYKKPVSLKFQNMCFCCMEGKFEFMLNGTKYELTVGDLMRVQKGNKYAIKNLLDGISIMQIIKNKPTET